MSIRKIIILTGILPVLLVVAAGGADVGKFPISAFLFDCIQGVGENCFVVHPLHSFPPAATIRG